MELPNPGWSILAIVGPTASGKSAVASALAEQLQGEIVSVDSMQVYRGMDIGTAKPTAADQARVRHHLIDVTDVTTGFDAAAFRETALPVIEDILARGRQPILCGGSGFYFAALLGRIGRAPASSMALRAELEALPLEQLLAELLNHDPVAHANIDRHNRRRVVRAVEVIRLTGRPFSGQRPNASRTESAVERESNWRTFGLLHAPETLRARIHMRVDAMLDQGLIQETEQLLAAGLECNRTALQAIGYSQAVDYLRGRHSLATTRELIRIRTRQFARRQMTWFRRQMQVTWLKVEATETAAGIATRIIHLLNAP